MSIFGLDFTSAPSRRKPITLAVCELVGKTLTLAERRELPTFVELETFLDQPGPWIAGLDFPFGQPRRLVEALGWPLSWAGYVEHVAALGRHGFEHVLLSYRSSRPPGDRHHFRLPDRPAGACSPMMLFGVPVGKMFFEGAPRLLRARCQVLPFEEFDPELGRSVSGPGGAGADRAAAVQGRPGFWRVIESDRRPARAARGATSRRHAARLRPGRPLRAGRRHSAARRPGRRPPRRPALRPPGRLGLQSANQ